MSLLKKTFIYGIFPITVGIAILYSLSGIGITTLGSTTVLPGSYDFPGSQETPAPVDPSTGSEEGTDTNASGSETETDESTTTGTEVEEDTDNTNSETDGNDSNINTDTDKPLEENPSLDVNTSKDPEEVPMADEPAPKVPTFSDYFSEQKDKVILVDEKTSLDALKGIILQGDILNYNPRKIPQGTLFADSPELFIKYQTTYINGKKLAYLDIDTDAQKLKNACISALNKPYDPENKDFEAIKKWCVVPTNQQALEEQGFEVARIQDDIKDAFRESDWLYKKDGSYSDYLRKHNFIAEKYFEGAEDDSYRKYNIIFKCRTRWNRPHELSNFPSTTVEGMSTFQITSLICVKPMTAGEYLANKYKITEFENLNEHDKELFFHEEGYSLEDYKNVKTTDAMNGKSFWGAVKFLYYKRKKPNQIRKS